MTSHDCMKNGVDRIYLFVTVRPGRALTQSPRVMPISHARCHRCAIVVTTPEATESKTMGQGR